MLRDQTMKIVFPGEEAKITSGVTFLILFQKLHYFHHFSKVLLTKNFRSVLVRSDVNSN